ncbi:hypothetical protein QYM36_003019 [Artemia franciscana]|uniref:Uncharacterized protein n=1 Tax=Artemia franciscana TaxID=6661 RepID=A0AA88I6E6_ARTSF|nr:hypothetical protein QYM36_003019 [Artemia franciscana]
MRPLLEKARKQSSDWSLPTTIRNCNFTWIFLELGKRSPYLVDYQLQFRPGSEIPVTDALSRLHLPDINKKLETDVYVHQIYRHLPISDEKIAQIQEETPKDSQLSVLLKPIHDG